MMLEGTCLKHDCWYKLKAKLPYEECYSDIFYFKANKTRIHNGILYLNDTHYQFRYLNYCEDRSCKLLSISEREFCYNKFIKETVASHFGLTLITDLDEIQQIEKNINTTYSDILLKIQEEKNKRKSWFKSLVDTFLP